MMCHEVELHWIRIGGRTRTRAFAGKTRAKATRRAAKWAADNLPVGGGKNVVYTGIVERPESATHCE